MPRVSARSNKGMHRGRDDEYHYDDDVTKNTQTASSGKDTETTTNSKSRDDPEYVDNGQADVDDDADHEEINCGPCGTTTENFDEDTDPYGDMVQCDKCNTWQHIKCMGLKKRTIPDDYICDECSGNPRPKPRREICQCLLQKKNLMPKEERVQLPKAPMEAILNSNLQSPLTDRLE